MRVKRNLASLTIAATLFAVPARSQDPAKGKLAMAKTIKCTFPLIVVGTWSGDQAKAEIKPAKLLLQFEDVNTDEGTARMEGALGGTYDITVRYAEGYLHFIQSFLNGPLYTTTVLEKKTADGNLKAMHSRHEFTDFALAGFTSSPEQYYGECEVVN